MTSTTDNLHHAEWCKAKRIETTEYPDRGITTHHCLDCAAHEARDDQGKALPTPAVTGGIATLGRGDWDVTMEKARPGQIPGVSR